jgi:hypothetical protein
LLEKFVYSILLLFLINFIVIKLKYIRKKNINIVANRKPYQIYSMSDILYYSNYCNHCKTLLSFLSKYRKKDEIHFLCIDRRVKKQDGIYIQLNNGQEILLPPIIKQVPSLLLLNRGNMLLTGVQVMEHFQHLNNQLNMETTNNNGEPEAFSINQLGNFHNDNFSFIDHDPNDMLAKGNGGTRQMYNYASLNHMDTIETPPENYTPNKIKEVSLDELRRTREKDLPPQHKRVG